MKEKAPDWQRLVLCFSEQDSSKYTQIHKGNSDLKALEQIANKWVDRRCYSTIDRALRALIAGDV
jgi:hypothetical protein